MLVLGNFRLKLGLELLVLELFLKWRLAAPPETGSVGLNLGFGGNGLGLLVLFGELRLTIPLETGSFGLNLGLGGVALLRQLRLVAAAETGFDRILGFRKDDALGEAWNPGPA